MSNVKLSEKESLEIITGMINETREHIENGTGNIQLIWGYISVIVSLIIYVGVKLTGSYMFMLCWWLIPILGWCFTLYMERSKVRKLVTIIDQVISKIWIVIGVCATLIPFMYHFIQSDLLFIESMLISVGVTISGLILKYRTFFIPGFTGILISLAMTTVRANEQILLFALLVIVILIIPGHIINHIAAKK